MDPKASHLTLHPSPLYEKMSRDIEESKDVKILQNVFVVMSKALPFNKKQCQSLDCQTNKHNSMETRKDRMARICAKLHDYVIWHHNKTTEEGWVYFVEMNTSLLKLVSKRNQSVT